LLLPGIKTFDDRNKKLREPVKVRAGRGLAAIETAFAEQELVDWLKQFGITEGLRVLDVGCGRGRFARAAAQIVGKTGFVLAADVDLGKLKESNWHEKPAQLSAICADGRDLPVRTARFDVAVLGFILHELPEPYPVLNEVRRLLQEDGKLLVFEWLPSVPVRAPGARRLPAEEVGRLFDSAGFRVENVGHLNASVYVVHGSMAKVLCCGAYSPVLV